MCTFGTEHWGLLEKRQGSDVCLRICFTLICNRFLFLQRCFINCNNFNPSTKSSFFVTFRKGLYCIAFLRVDYKSSSPKNKKGTSICLFNARSNCQSSSAKTNRTAITWYDRQSHETHSEDHGWPHGKIPFCNSLDYERSTSFRLSNHSEFRFLRHFLQGERFWKEKYK